MAQRWVDAVLMRGGTSKGLFLMEDAIPPAGPERDALFIELMGSPDVNQIDGLGGGSSSTSKVVVVRRSTRADCDIEFLFGQVGVRDALVDYRPNSGNLTAAVGPYAIDEGLVDVTEPVTSLTMLNLNTNTRIRTHVPVVDGQAAVDGDLVIAGSPRPGARIVNEHLEPAGALLDRGLLPTGNVRDDVTVGTDTVEVSIVDAANLVMFVAAPDLGLTGTELPDQVNQDQDVIERVERLRAQAAVMLGLVQDPSQAHIESPIVPLPVVVAPSTTYRTTQGTTIEADRADVVARAFSLQRMHHAYSLTALVCTASAAHVPGTIVSDLRDASDEPTVRVGHAKGVAAADVTVSREGNTAQIVAVGVTRTARRLMAGRAYYRLDGANR